VNQLELLKSMAKVGFVFGKDMDKKTWLAHPELFESLEKWTSAMWGDQLYYKFHLDAPLPHLALNIDGFEVQHKVYLDEEDEAEMNLDRIITGVIHMYSWIP
jgi:hypothetical protein